MQGMEASVPQAKDTFLLFATSRPSRATEVLPSEQDLIRRSEREKTWAASIGMDTTRSASWTLTGSTGTRPPVHIEEGIADDIIG